MADIAFPTNTLNTSNDPVGAGQQGALAGLEIGQKQAGINALQGVDLNNPASLDAAVGSSIRAGALEQAGAVQNLGLTRSVLQSPLVQNALTGQNGQSSASAPGAAAAAPTDLTPDQIAQHQAITGQAVEAAKSLLALPLDQRPAAAAQIKAQFLQHGVPEAAVDSALDDLSDKGLTAVSAHLQANAGLAAAPEAQAAAPHPTGYQWARDALDNNTLNSPVVQSVLKRAGFDMGPQLDRAERLVMPEITAAANAGQAGVAEANKLAATNKATTGIVKINGVDHEVPMDVKLALEGDSALRAQGVGVDLSPRARAEAEASGGAAGRAPYDTKDITVGGVPHTYAGDVAAEILHNPQASAAGVGVGLGPGQRVSQEGDATALVEAQKAASDPNRQETLQRAVINGNQITGLANTITTGKYTDAFTKLAQVVPGLSHKASEYATNSELLKQDLSGSFQSQLAGMAIPRLNSEAKSITGAIPPRTNPQDQLRLYGAGTAAAADYAKTHDQFITEFAANPANPRSLAAAQLAWNNGPGARSILSYPEFRNLTINGHPATVVDPKSGWGVFMPGTSAQFKFRAR